MSAFTEEQLELISSVFNPLFNNAKFEALTEQGENATSNEGITVIRCRIPLDSSKSMMEAALNVGGSDYQRHAVSVLKLFCELRPEDTPASTAYGWHISDTSDLDFLTCDYSLYWYKSSGDRQGGIQITLSLKGADPHMSLKKPSKAKAEAAPAPAAPTEATDSPWGKK